MVGWSRPVHGPVFLLYQKGRDSFQAQDRAIDGRHKGSTALISFIESPVSGVYRPEFFPSARAENRRTSQNHRVCHARVMPEKVGSPRVIPARGASSGSAAFRRRRAGPKTVRRRNRSPSWASAMTYRPRFLPELWLCRAAPLARSRRRRARPCVELLHNLRAGQPPADRPQPGGPAGVHDADRLSARPAGLCRGSHNPAQARRGRCPMEHVAKDATE